MTFSLVILLYIYYAFLALWAIFFLAGLYHMLKFGFKTFFTFLSTFFFLVVAVVMLSVSFYYINQLEWDINISLFEGLLDAFKRPMPFQ
ncbi:MAG: hypothetical protein V1867_01380 [Candidatus Falkowbacteria bacterium]